MLRRLKPEALAIARAASKRNPEIVDEGCKGVSDGDIALISARGLSWDETWAEDRILKIKSNYEKVTWVFASAKTT